MNVLFLLKCNNPIIDFVLLFRGVTFHKGSGIEIQLLPQNSGTALAIQKFLEKGVSGEEPFFKKGFPSNTAIYLSFTIIDVLFRFKTNN